MSKHYVITATDAYGDSVIYRFDGGDNPSAARYCEAHATCDLDTGEAYHGRITPAEATRLGLVVEMDPQ